MVKIIFLGDISLNSTYEEILKQGIDPFSGLKDIFKASDFVIGNLECMIRGSDVNLKKYPRLATSREAYSMLDTLNLSLVTLAHNHVYDGLKEGFENTVGELIRKNISYIGASTVKEESLQPYLKNINGIRFCFLNYVTENTTPALPDDCDVFINYYEKEKILRDINRYRPECDYIILLFHWGGDTEGYKQPKLEQQADARLFIDSGADLIVAGHSHVLQPYEIYKGKYIFYSLGNFCFGDIIRRGKVHSRPKVTKEGVILKTVFSDNGYSIELYPVRNVNNIVQADPLINKNLKKRIRIWNFISKNKSIFKIYYFTMRISNKIWNLIRLAIKDWPLFYDKLSFYFKG